jgi:hypothetical protein
MGGGTYRGREGTGPYFKVLIYYEVTELEIYVVLSL